MTLRRGFKSEANSLSREMRQELGLLPHDPLCAWTLAEHLGYTVVGFTQLGAGAAAAVRTLSNTSLRSKFSAVTLNSQGNSWIIHNDTHHPRRQSSNIAHEVAHGLLCHSLGPLTNVDGSRSYNRELEEEANWLGPTLLVSEEATIYIVEQGIPDADACALYKVSSDLLTWRLRMTGAHVRVARRRAA